MKLYKPNLKCSGCGKSINTSTYTTVNIPKSGATNEYIAHYHDTCFNTKYEITSKSINMVIHLIIQISRSINIVPSTHSPTLFELQKYLISKIEEYYANKTKI